MLDRATLQKEGAALRKSIANYIRANDKKFVVILSEVIGSKSVYSSVSDYARDLEVPGRLWGGLPELSVRIHATLHMSS
jgi:hypothetical protein